MLRKALFGAVAAVAIGFGAQSATAGDPVRGPIGGPVVGFGRGPVGGSFGGAGGFVPGGHGHGHHDHDYVVLIRHRGHWDRYDRFETRYEAERVARRLEYRGYDTRIQVVEGGRRW